MRAVGDLLAKARHSVASARAIFELGDYDGACNRAYYAIFQAAKAALIAVDSPAAHAKTHSGTAAAFAGEFIRTGKIPAETGKSLAVVDKLRALADYTAESVPVGEAKWAAEAADRFMAAIEALPEIVSVMGDGGGRDDS